MNYNFNGKTLRIPDAEIETNMKVLGMTKDEAIQMWLEDEGYEVNEMQEELCQKAKENRITATIHGAREEKAKKSQKERVKKADPTKEQLIADIADFLQDYASDIVIENKSKLITFKMGEDKFKLDLIRTREKKK